MFLILAWFFVKIGRTIGTFPSATFLIFFSYTRSGYLFSGDGIREGTKHGKGMQEFYDNPNSS